MNQISNMKYLIGFTIGGIIIGGGVFLYFQQNPIIKEATLLWKIKSDVIEAGDCIVKCPECFDFGFLNEVDDFEIDKNWHSPYDYKACATQGREEYCVENSSPIKAIKKVVEKFNQ